MKSNNLNHLSAAFGSLVGYYLARLQGEDQWYPWTLLGGVAGAVIAEIITRKLSKEAAK